jgi:hypothetical protein
MSVARGSRRSRVRVLRGGELERASQHVVEVAALDR